ncbi:hypothetical protein [Novosphingobium sp.]|nr:hypothetical protein [Novosphingobium sp.]
MNLVIALFSARPELVEGLLFTSGVAPDLKNKNGPSTGSGRTVIFGYA